MPFPYKNVLVTGATSGIGYALTERMVTNGIHVVAVGRRQERLDALQAAHGSAKVAIENFDLADLAGLPAWVKKQVSTSSTSSILCGFLHRHSDQTSFSSTTRITAAYPFLDCVILNAGFQQVLDFTEPASLPLDAATAEMNTNYLSPLHATALFLPHLTSRAPNPAAIVYVTSGLALVPLSVCPGYCASKAAVHSLAWTLRSQLASESATSHLRVIEIIPPAVQTELHTRQGRPATGMPLADFIDETWQGLCADDAADEIMPKLLQQQAGTVEDEKRKAFSKFDAIIKAQVIAAKAAKAATGP